jgi:hypothetical protein
MLSLLLSRILFGSPLTARVLVKPVEFPPEFPPELEPELEDSGAPIPDPLLEVSM